LASFQDAYIDRLEAPVSKGEMVYYDRPEGCLLASSDSSAFLTNSRLLIQTTVLPFSGFVIWAQCRSTNVYVSNGRLYGVGFQTSDGICRLFRRSPGYGAHPGYLPIMDVCNSQRINLVWTVYKLGEVPSGSIPVSAISGEVMELRSPEGSISSKKCYENVGSASGSGSLDLGIEKVVGCSSGNIKFCSVSHLGYEVGYHQDSYPDEFFNFDEFVGQISPYDTDWGLPPVFS